MRVLLDANIWISYLLTPGSKRTIVNVVEYCFQPDVQILLPGELEDEVSKTVRRSEYLSGRIPDTILTQLFETLRDIAEIPPALQSEGERISRDPDDDYLLLNAIVYDVDYLITGDRDLLILKQFEKPRILSPATFADMFFGPHPTT